MNLIIRGTLWFGLYGFLVIFPLITAAITNSGRIAQPFLVEVAVGAGFVGFAVMALEFALVSRINAAAGAFGEDSLQHFHNIMGKVALGLILAHPALLIISGYPAGCWLNPFAACATRETITASLAVYVLLLLICTSVWRKQLRIPYEVWQTIHGLFALFVIFGSLIHIFMIGRYTSTTSLKVVWLIYMVLVAWLITWYRVLKPLRLWNKRWAVVENREEFGNARTIFLQPKGHDGFNFMPGHSLGSRLEARPLVPVSTPFRYRLKPTWSRVA